MTQVISRLTRQQHAGARTIQTTTLLPSGAVLAVRVEHQPNGHVTLSDDGSGAEDVHALGVAALTSADRRRGEEIAAQHGLLFVDQGFQVRDLAPAQMEAALAHLAEAVRRWSAETLAAALRHREAEVVRLVEERVRRGLPGVKLDRGRELPGASGKRHSFDLVAHLPAERLAIFQVVARHPAALSAAHLKLFDLREAHPDWPREVVTESIAAWDAPDLLLLSGVATHVRDFSSDWSDIGKLAA